MALVTQTAITTIPSSTNHNYTTTIPTKVMMSVSSFPTTYSWINQENISSNSIKSHTRKSGETTVIRHNSHKNLQAQHSNVFIENGNLGTTITTTDGPKIFLYNSSEKPHILSKS